MSEANYQPNIIEKTVQDYWQKNQSFLAEEIIDQPTYYCLSMLPYPSGELHMGHVRNYTIGDVISRYHTMLGYHVLQPLGWDAFGLPAENAALKNDLSPHDWTLENIVTMKEQLQSMGLAIDWKREITTCDENYYKWNQWLFLKMYEKGLAYQKESMVNWDPVDQTVLANEQVINGCGWRSGAPVEQKKINQWFFKITSYANELYDEIDNLEKWPAEVKKMQKNWIGRSHGLDIHFAIKDDSNKLIAFTTRPETIFGASFIAISTDHPLALKASKNNPDIAQYIQQKQSSTSEKDFSKADKHGIDSGMLAIHPLSQKCIPIWICNYVLSGFGTGCVMGVPAHDERDHAFAKKYNLPIIPVIQNNQDWDYSIQALKTKSGTLINSEQFNKLNTNEAKEAISQTLSNQASGGKVTNFRLRDWGISRQRYWGTPIPIIYCDKCQVVPVEIKDLPVKLPLTDNLSKNGNPLDAMQDFVTTTCPKCLGPAKRETDTMDTFVDSSWYFLRYTSFNQNHAMLDDRAKFWAPVDQYVGGIEHANMHLLYARFIYKVLRDFGLINSNEPFKALLTQGMVLKDNHKMSKSKGNVVSPAPLIEKYGADTIRLYSMFTAPPEQALEWSDSSVEGAYKFLCKLYQMADNHADKISDLSSFDLSKINAENLQIRANIHLNLKQILYDYSRQKFNTVVSGAMKLFALIQNITDPHLFTESLSILLRILNPITPHICQYLWEKLGFGDNICQAKLPIVDENVIKELAIPISIQINGKLRGVIKVSSSLPENEINNLAINESSIQKHLENKSIKKTIFVPGKLINFVVA